MKLNVFGKRRKDKSILDLPFKSYDPSTALPKEIIIGDKKITPLVNIQQVKDHLTILSAFHTIREEIPPSSWSTLCDRAAEEYVHWIKEILPFLSSEHPILTTKPTQSGSIQQNPSKDVDNRPNLGSNDPTRCGDDIRTLGNIQDGGDGDVVSQESGEGRSMKKDKELRKINDDEINTSRDKNEKNQMGIERERKERGMEFEDLEELPSLPIIMCWHAHMLNPARYQQDIESDYHSLKKRLFPLRQVASAINQNKLLYDLPIPPSDSNVSNLQREMSELTCWKSQDISEAVKRQGKFILNMKGIGWLEHGKFDEELIPLQRGIVRYHAWLDLMYSTQSKHFLVPTLDIDLTWHTHQLLPSYSNDTMTLLNRETLLDHNDSASEGKLDDGLKITCKLWEDKYGWKYLF
ncbi:hypothetical protein M231_06818 [Tremella mesenterica]|uniref:Uncharacterized protein n=1 Tax=Tremella mesenterica TaxID=5217 RepID=A0A4Q1BAS8_TREME|nr:hypothetical protein M231_06818 [Tremella mesenterica]